MTERPILFSAPMVRALLDGNKTQTRRVVKMPPSWDCFVCADWGNGWWPYRSDDGESPNYDNNEIPMRCPYGQPGDRLWVRETWYCDDFRVQRGPYVKPDDLDVDDARATGMLVYAADGAAPYEAEQPVWKPSIHMPRWASRILLEIVSVRVERLQDIGSEEIEAEGVVTSDAAIMEHGCRARVIDFTNLWESINGAGSWNANPWVWVIEFQRVTP